MSTPLPKTKLPGRPNVRYVLCGRRRLNCARTAAAPACTTCDADVTVGFSDVEVVCSVVPAADVVRDLADDTVVLADGLFIVVGGVCGATAVADVVEAAGIDVGTALAACSLSDAVVVGASVVGARELSGLEVVAAEVEARFRVFGSCDSRTRGFT